MNWNALVDRVAPYVVRIETPGGHGTGFLCFYNEDQSMLGIATAFHVVAYAEEWQQPIRIRHASSNKVLLLKEADRAILGSWESDSAVILVQPSELPFPDRTIPLLPNTSRLDIGTEVGWLGFPSVAPYTLCFFSGNVSARDEGRHAYFIDGVAINGVSGGPVIYTTDTEGLQIVGSISAYLSNRATGDTLPGLAMARDVSHFHEIASMLKDLDEAKKKQKEQESTGPEVQSSVPAPEQCLPNQEQSSGSKL